MPGYYSAIEGPCREHVEEAHRADLDRLREAKDELQERIAERAVTEDTIKQSNPKDAIGSSKVPFSTLPFPVILECGMLIRTLNEGQNHPLSYLSAPVLMEYGLGMLEGAIKYRRHNYRVIGVRASVYYDATMRHISDWLEGEEIDPGSGMSHLTKAGTSLLVLRDAMIRGKMIDDRPPGTRGFMDEFYTKPLMASNKSVVELVSEAILHLGVWWEDDEHPIYSHSSPITAALSYLMLARDLMIRGEANDNRHEGIGAFVEGMNHKTKELLGKYEVHEQPYTKADEEGGPDDYRN